MTVPIVSKGTSMQIVLGPILTRRGAMPSIAGRPRRGSAAGTLTVASRTPITRNVEIKSRNNGSSDLTVACSTVDEFVRLTLDLRGRQQRAWATPLPNAEEGRGTIEAVYG